jgi:dihydrolipoamide dehydrogenase
MAETTFDVVVIGAGPGGYSGAIRAAQLGLKTAIVERDKDLGGTCLLRGCIPTKQYLHSASLLDAMKHADEFGLEASSVGFNFAKVYDRKSKVVSQLAKGVEFLMKKNKITVFKGTGSLAGKGKVNVTDAGGKVQTIDTKNVIIATGSATKLLPGLEVKMPRVVTSDELLELKEVPKSMVVLGAGAVGVEFASVFAHFGSQVTVIELLPRVVPIEDEEISKELARVYKKRKINVLTNTKFQSAKVGDNDVEVTYQDDKGKEGKITCETLLVATGRHAHGGAERLRHRRRDPDALARARRGEGGLPRRRAHRGQESAPD